MIIWRSSTSGNKFDVVSQLHICLKYEGEILEVLILPYDKYFKWDNTIFEENS